MMSKILVVDDEPDIREILTMMIEAVSDCDIVQAESGNRAIKILEEDNDVSIIFCDYRMQDGNGGDVYKYVRGRDNFIPYVMISTDRPEDHVELLNFKEHHPQNDYLAKPVSVEHLTAIIEGLQK